jgi:hypothetical protein
MPITIARPSCASQRVRAESPNRFFAASAIVRSSSDPSSPALADLPDDAVLAFNVRAFRPVATVQPDRIGARVPHERQEYSASQLSVDLYQPLEGTYVWSN